MELGGALDRPGHDFLGHDGLGRQLGAVVGEGDPLQAHYRDIDDVLDVRALSRLEQPAGAVNVGGAQPPGLRRGRPRMHDRLHVRDGGVKTLAGGEVALHPVCAGAGAPAHDPGPMPGAAQRHHQVPAQGASAASDEHVHGGSIVGDGQAGHLR